MVTEVVFLLSIKVLCVQREQGGGLTRLLGSMVATGKQLNLQIRCVYGRLTNSTCSELHGYLQLERGLIDGPRYMLTLCI